MRTSRQTSCPPTRLLSKSDMSFDHNTNHTSSASSDASLLAAITQGDEAAMARLYSRHAKRIYSVALRVLRDRSSAEDVLQDIFMQIWRKPTTFIANRGSLESWLGVVARNRAIDVIRRRRPSELVDDLPLPSRQNVAAEVEQSVTLDRVKQVVATLPQGQRRALELAFFQGLTHTEIAKETGDPLGTVKTRIRVGLKTLGKVFRYEHEPTMR